MTATTTTARIDPQTQEELMRQAGIWIEHSTLIEDDLPARPLAAVQAEKHQLDRYTQLVADRAAARDSKCLAQIEEPAGAAPAAVAPCIKGLLDEDGENQAVRTFLMLYGTGLTVARMREHMELAGWPQAPEWALKPEAQGHLTKGGAQSWLRHLFALETNAPALEAPAAPVRQPLTDERIEPLFRARQQMQVVGEKDEWFWFAWGVADAERAHGITAAAPQAPAAPVAYLDLGAGGYMDLGTDLSEQQLGALPKGRHMLAIIGTHGIDGYAAAPAAPVTPAAAMAALKAAFAADPEYAWSWHCAAWSCAHDEGLATDAANRAAARLMYMAFDCDTSKHPNFLDEHRRAAPAAPAVDASDTALLDAMERERIAVIPEFEGPWDAQIFGEDEATLSCGSGATPREAIAEALASLEARKAHDAAQAAAKGGGIVSKTERLGHANALIEIISRHGRRFFRNRESGAIARLELDASGRLWWIDEYRGSRVYTGKVMGYPHRWRGFSHGGTLRSLVEALRGYVLRGELLHPEYIAPSRIDPTNGDIWGYGAEAAAAVRAEAHALPLFQRPTGHKEST